MSIANNSPEIFDKIPLLTALILFSVFISYDFLLEGLVAAANISPIIKRKVR